MTSNLSRIETQTYGATGVSVASSVDLSSGSCVSGTFDCVDGQFGQCVNGKLILTSCISGTACTKTDVGGNTVVMCSSTNLTERHVKRYDHRYRYRHFLIGRARRH